MPTIKLKRLTFDTAETFNALNKQRLLTLFQNQNELVIRDGMIYDKICQLEKSRATISKLTEENEELKKNQVNVSALISEKDKLKEQLQENSKPLDEYKTQNVQYESEINKLKSQGDKQRSQIQELNNKIKTLEKDKQDIQKESQELQASNKELSKSTEAYEDIREIFNKWGTYQSLQKDIAIVKLFMEKPDQEIRQKTIIDRFRRMDKTTVRLHLYKLVRKGILKEPQFKGSYQLNTNDDTDGLQGIAPDVDRIAGLILGENLYEMAVDQHRQKTEESED